MIEAVAPIVDFSSYREQKMAAVEFDDKDIHDLLLWHMAAEGYDDGPDNKPIFDVYEYDDTFSKDPDSYMGYTFVKVESAK